MNFDDNEDELIWSSQQWNITQALQLWKLNFSTFLVLKHACTTSTGPPRQWKRLYLSFPALEDESTSIAQPLKLSKLKFSTFLVPMHAYLTSIGPPRQWKRVYLIFQALRQDSTSIAQPQQLKKLNFRTFLVPKHACTTPTTVKTALLDLSRTWTGFHEHRTTSTVVEIEL